MNAFTPDQEGGYKPRKGEHLGSAEASIIAGEISVVDRSAWTVYSAVAQMLPAVETETAYQDQLEQDHRQQGAAVIGLAEWQQRRTAGAMGSTLLQQEGEHAA